MCCVLFTVCCCGVSRLDSCHRSGDCDQPNEELAGGWRGRRRASLNQPTDTLHTAKTRCLLDSPRSIVPSSILPSVHRLAVPFRPAGLPLLPFSVPSQPSVVGAFSPSFLLHSSSASTAFFVLPFRSACRAPLLCRATRAAPPAVLLLACLSVCPSVCRCALVWRGEVVGST